MSKIDNYDYLIKCIIIGDNGIGKSALMLRYTDEEFNDSLLTTIGVDYKFKTVNINSEIIKFQIWDTSGQERFKSITTTYYRESSVVILCYDITDPITFLNLDAWLNEIKNHASPNVLIVICGTKFDLASERKISYDDAKLYCDNKNLKYFEVSAKSNLNINKIFYEISQEIIKIKSSDDLTNVTIRQKSGKISLDHLITKKKSCC